MRTRCLRSLEDRLQYTSFAMKQRLQRVIYAIYGRLLGGVFASASPESSLLAQDSPAAWWTLVLVDLQDFSAKLSSSFASHISSSAPPLKVCLLLRLLPVFVSGICFTKYSTTFSSPWTPLLLVLAQWRTVKLRKLRAFMTRLWAVSLLDPFHAAAFSYGERSEEGTGSDMGVSLKLSVLPSPLQQAYKEACAIVADFPTPANIATFENPSVVMDAVACPSTGYVPAASTSTPITTHYTAVKNAKSFLTFHVKWKERMQGFCEYVMCSDSLWQGTTAHPTRATGASTSTSARIDLVMDTVFILWKQTGGDLTMLDKERKQLLRKLMHSLMNISVILCGRILCYLRGDVVSDLISEIADVSAGGSPPPGGDCSSSRELADQWAYHLFCCHQVVEVTAADEEHGSRRGGQDVTSWKQVLLAFCDCITADQNTLVLADYHARVTTFLAGHPGPTAAEAASSHSAPRIAPLVPPSLLQEVKKLEQMLQSPPSTLTASPLLLPRVSDRHSDTFVKVAELIKRGS